MSIRIWKIWINQLIDLSHTSVEKLNRRDPMKSPYTPTLFSIYQTAGSFVSPIHAGLGASGCCGRERPIHTAGGKSWGA